MAILPIRCGNSNRADLQQIAASLLQQRGDAITTAPGTVIWTEVQAHARAVYSIWAVNQKMANQFDPNKMTDFLGRWESILGLGALPTDSIQQRQERVAARFALINQFPTEQAVHDLLAAALGTTFIGIVDNPISALTQFPGGVNITGGASNVVNGPWLSTIQNVMVETTHPAYMTNNQYYATVNQLYSLLNAYLPSYVTFDWFWSGFCDDGYTTPGKATISVTVGSTALTGVGTAWHTPIDTDGTLNLVPGSIIEAFDDAGDWQRLTVATVNSNTSITLASPAISTITAQHYVMLGVYLDSDYTQFPYPPVGCLNLDNAGFNSV